MRIRSARLDIAVIAVIGGVFGMWLLALGIQQLRRGRRTAGWWLTAFAAVLLAILVFYAVLILFFSHGEL